MSLCISVCHIFRHSIWHSPVWHFFFSGTSSGILAGISWHSEFYLPIHLKPSDILYGILAGISSSFLSGLSSALISGKPSDILYGISSGILTGISLSISI